MNIKFIIPANYQSLELSIRRLFSPLALRKKFLIFLRNFIAMCYLPDFKIYPGLKVYRIEVFVTIFVIRCVIIGASDKKT